VERVEVKRSYSVYKNDNSVVPVFAWVDGVPFEDAAKEQAMQLSRLPFIFKHVAIMPDVHAGYGSTVGCVVATRDVVMPAAVGVDIGCGMTALETTIKRERLRGDIEELRGLIELAVPCGFGKGGPTGTWGASVPADVREVWDTTLSERYDAVCNRLPGLRHKQPLEQLGTLGSGNHFVEVCEDEGGFVWIMLHSGSRGPGNRIGTGYTKAAQELCARWLWTDRLPHKDLAFIPHGDPMFFDYVKAVHWAQDYALENRKLILRHALEALFKFNGGVVSTGDVIACHHNYLAQESHFGANVWVTRKGAVRAREGDRVIIPGSMGRRSIIGAGLGNADSFTSCSHGAGRTMSRTKARATITLDRHNSETEGVACDKTVDTIDESPSAYKDLDAVLNAERDLVRPEKQLKQFVCVKGKS
jgi:tRNA-splicing ligase RtcB